MGSALAELRGLGGVLLASLTRRIDQTRGTDTSAHELTDYVHDDAVRVDRLRRETSEKSAKQFLVKRVTQLAVCSMLKSVQ